MKMTAYLFLIIISLSLLLAPATELLCLFSDMCKINSALISSSRAAVLMAADVNYVQDTEAVISSDRFEELFRTSFCKALGLEVDLSNPNKLNSKAEEILNDFRITFTPEQQRDSSGMTVVDSAGNAVIIGCKIEVTTNYKFKTSLMRRYVESLVTVKTPIRLMRHQTLRLDF